MSELLIMIIEFFKTGLFSIGGGLATIPFLKEMAVKYDWFTLNELSNMIGISESTPGPMGVNMATYVGTVAFGPLGGIIATLSLITPSIIVITIVYRFFDAVKKNKSINDAFYGVRPFVLGLVVNATISIFLSALLRIDAFKASGNFLDVFNLVNIVLFAAGLFVYKKFNVHPILVIVFFAFVGIFLQI